MRIIINHAHVRHLATRCHSSVGGVTDHRLRIVRRWAPVTTRRPGVVRARTRTQSTQQRLTQLAAQMNRFAAQLNTVQRRASLANNGGQVSWLFNNRSVRLTTPARRPATGLTTNSSLNSLLGLVNSFGTSNRTPGLSGLNLGGFVPAGSSSWNLGGFSNPNQLAAAANLGVQNGLNFLGQFTSSALGVPKPASGVFEFLGPMNNALSRLPSLSLVPPVSSGRRTGSSAFSGLGTANANNLIFRNTSTSIGLRSGNLGL